jgi:Polyketide cyclase / dehydrase and lipid transport
MSWSHPAGWLFYFGAKMNERMLQIDIKLAYTPNMKLILSFLLSFMASMAFAQNVPTPNDLKVSVSRVGGKFQVSASYQVPITLCGAYAFLTDYEGARNIPGIVESKIIAREGNKVKVARTVEERILLIPIEMHSVVEYTESLNQGLAFEQISGDAKYYKGTWSIAADGELTLFKYQGAFEPQSSMPNFVIEYFIKNSMRDRFLRMAERAAQKSDPLSLACRS